MSCLQAPKLPVPNLSLLLPSLTIPLPLFPGLTLCCTVPGLIPSPPLIVPIGLILAPLGPAGDAIVTSIQSAIASLNALIDQIPPINCPLD